MDKYWDKVLLPWRTSESWKIGIVYCSKLIYRSRLWKTI